MGAPNRIRVHEIPALDGYRGLASMLVLTTHVGFATGAILWPGFGQVIGRMDFGVALFFLLSGFLLSQPWFAAAEGHRGWPSTGVYALRRAARILPAYWAAMTAALLLLPQNATATVADWIRYAFLVQIYSEPEVFGGLTHLWSLAVEVSFYLLLPLLMWVMIRWRRGPHAGPSSLLPLLLGVLVAGIAFRLTAIGLLEGTTAELWLPGYLDWFAAGMLAGYARVLTWRPVPPSWVSGLRDVASDGPSCIGVGLLLFAISCTPVAGPVTLVGPTLWEGMAKHMLYAAAAFFLLLPAFLGPHDSLVSRAMSVPPLRRLGQISYGVFLWHLLLLELLQPALGIPLFGGGFWRLWPITVGASIAVATVSWLVLESPVLTRAHAVREGGSSPPVKDRSPTGHPSGGS